MSKLDKLLRELCPDGVKYKKLVDAISIERGKRVVRSQLSIRGKYPVYQNSLTPLGYHTDYNYNANTTFIIVAGAAGEIGFSDKAFWAADDCFTVVCPENVLNRYIYHLLLNNQNQLASKVRKASIPRLSRSAIENLVIPIPPLDVQREIVRMLDSYTESVVELQRQLTAELTARKAQYSHYRDILLSYTSTAQMEKLGDTCKMKAGKAITSGLISDECTEETPIKCYGGNGVRGYVKNANENGSYPIIGRQGALCGNVKYAEGQFYATEHAVVVKPKEKYNPRFLYHLLTNMNLNQYKSAGAQPGLAVKNIAELVAPVPPLDVQNRIVNVLDNFEKICSDLNIGLPAEIEARQKQYEYYRDKLLTFVETGNTILSRAEQSRAEQSRAEQSRALIKLLQYVFGYAVVTFEDIAENCDSMRKPVTSGKREAGKYPYYGASGIVDYVKDYIFDGDYLLVSEDGANLLARSTPIAFSISGKNWVNNHAHVLKFDCYETRRFVEFYLNSIDLAPYISGGAQPKLNQKNLNRIEIPLPSQERQKYIVDILDRFDAICNDLTSGLPAEIEARQKQYEYYRDKLLTFKEVAAT